MNPGSFRQWCQEKWFEHKDELESYKQPLCYNANEYFGKYKYWLKREFKYQQAESK